MRCTDYSVQYRAILSACASELSGSPDRSEEVAEAENVTDHSTNCMHQVSHLHKLGSVWHLAEIFFLRAPVLVRNTGLLRGIEDQLLLWVQQRDDLPQGQDWTKVMVQMHFHLC